MEILIDGEGRVPEGVATAVSVGAYDGIHLGHRKVLSAVVALAADQGLQTAVVTFDKHPAAVVRPESAPLLLTDHDQRVALFEEIGIDYLFLLRFDQRRAETSDHDFVADVLVDRLNAKVIAVGSDFHFGKGRSGSVDSLRELGADMGFAVQGLELLTASEDAPVSSTAIRVALTKGDIASVNTMLGRNYEIRGEVVQGDHRAHSIGFPTANIAYQPGRASPTASTPAEPRCPMARPRPPQSTLGCGQRSTRMPTSRYLKFTSSASTAICTDSS